MLRLLFLMTLLSIAGCDHSQSKVDSPTFTVQVENPNFPKRLPDSGLQFLRNAEDMELFALVAWPEVQEGGFHHKQIIGSEKIVDPKQRSRVADAIEYAVNGNAAVADCFDPRHGIRIEVAGEQQDFLICFDCGLGHWYHGKEHNLFMVSQGARERLDSVLSDFGIPFPFDPSKHVAKR